MFDFEPIHYKDMYTTLIVAIEVLDAKYRATCVTLIISLKPRGATRSLDWAQHHDHDHSHAVHHSGTLTALGTCSSTQRVGINVGQRNSRRMGCYRLTDCGPALVVGLGHERLYTHGFVSLHLGSLAAYDVRGSLKRERP